MTACASCGRRLARGSGFCASCGRAARGQAPDVVVELDGHGATTGGHDVVLAPARLSRRWLAGGLVGALAAVVAASVASGGEGATVPTTSLAATTSIGTSSGTSSGIAATTAATIPARFAIGTGPLLGEPTGLALLLALGQRTYRVDLDAATVTLVDLGSSVYDLQLTPIGLMYRTGDGGLAQLRRAGGAATNLGDPVGYLGAGPAGRAWFVRYGDGGNDPTFWYQDAGGRPTEFSLPVGHGVPDGAGGLLLDAPGGTYRWVPGGGGPRRLSPGRLKLAGGGLALVDECDEAMQCADVLLDVGSGEHRPLPVPAPGTPAYTDGRISPDGRVLFVVHDIDTGAPSWSAVTLDGDTVPLGRLSTNCLSVGCTLAPQWSPDGRWVVWSPDQAALAAWRPGLAEPVRVTLPDGERPDTFNPGRPELSYTVGALADLVAIGGDR